MMRIIDDFNKSLNCHWTQVLSGGAYAKFDKSVLRLGYDKATSDNYTDAQIDDYTMLGKSDYLWKPPLCMTIRARFSHDAATTETSETSTNVLRGTAGFGFWNKPFTMQGNWFALPQAIWFFYAGRPSNMVLVPELPGWGWKAQVINTTAMGAAVNAIPAVLSAGYGRVASKQPTGHAARRFAGAHEKIITENMKDWHTYKLEWREHGATFRIDDNLLFKTTSAPSKSLGFVAWLDNEYAIATPRGELKFGKINSGKQWLDIDTITIEPL